MTHPAKRRIVIVAFVLALVVMIVWPLVPLADAGERLKAIPASGPGFSLRTVPLGDADKNLLGDAGALCAMISPREGNRLLLTVIDGTRNRHAVHDPFYCFAGAGWKMESKSAIALGAGEGMLFTMSKDGQSSEALCFYDNGSSQFSSPVEYWLRTSWRRASLGTGGAEPVLVMCRTLPGEKADWSRVRQVILPSLGFD